ncbi:MAG: hypothetical protein QOJ81_583 [Chloroflexota bacterium]|jgi:hypothetical protein|nr:hypothetical protein [Chloroflexota bacterium]
MNAARTFRLGRWRSAAQLLVLAAVALVVVGCGPGGPAGPAGTAGPAGGDIHLRITKAFDNRADEEDLWNSGTISADGEFPASRLDTMDMGVIYDGNDLGTWSASTQQQMGDFEGECNGSSDCRPCTVDFGGSWDIASIDFTVQERGNGRYVIDLWLGSETPPKTGGCDPTFGDPVYWASNLTVTLTGIGTATPAGSADGYTVEVTQ